jgi:hypothetical protein
MSRLAVHRLGRIEAMWNAVLQRRFGVSFANSTSGWDRVLARMFPTRR